MIDAGGPAPELSLPDHTGQTVALADQRGRWVVLWWFPKAMTNGCTREGQAFRDLAGEFAALGATILGISFDTVEDNRAFAEANGFTYPLLSDVDRRVGRAYGVERRPDDEKPDYPWRATFLIDPEGRVRKAYRVTDAASHPAQVLEDLRALAAAAG